MNIQKSIIPESSPIYQTLKTSAIAAKAVIFSGLPGVGKSLYINQFKGIALSQGRIVTVIQWDVARKAFETPMILERFPMGDGLVHDGVKLSVGVWLLDVVKKWLVEHSQKSHLLLIEAPFVGHRFIELAKIQSDDTLEAFFSSADVQFIVPIPSKKVRTKIEADRTAQIADDAKVWMGAKPAVMLMLWKMICGIANEFGRDISMNEQPPYDPEVYEFVFRKILRHRHYIPLHINEVFDVHIKDEKELHNIGSLVADAETANHFARIIIEKYLRDKAISDIIKNWYRV